MPAPPTFTATMLKRSIAHHRRALVAVALGAVAASAALSGALIVGDSVRQSLRDLAIRNLAGVDHAMVAPRFFDASLVRRLAVESKHPASFRAAAAIIVTTGSATNPGSGAAAHQVNVYGVDQTFWLAAEPPESSSSLDSGKGKPASTSPPLPLTGRNVAVNQQLADELGIETGDALILRMPKPERIASETAIGRRDDTTRSLRLHVARILPNCGSAMFTLSPGPKTPQNVFVPLATLQKSLDQQDRTNAILLFRDHPPDTATDSIEPLRQRLKQSITLANLGLTVRANEHLGYVAVQSDQFFLLPAVESAARAAAESLGIVPAATLAYLANEIALDARNAATPVPYSTIVAIDRNTLQGALLRNPDHRAITELRPGTILLNQWTADALGASAGQPIRLTYYATGPYGSLATLDATFTIADIVAMTPAATDPDFVPEYPHVTDTDDIADWDPPFPMHLDRITDGDEAYWDRYRTAPKAFVNLADGQRLWADQPERFGRVTAIRLYPTGTDSLDDLKTKFHAALFERLDPAALGFVFRPVRSLALQSAKGSTDFGGLFIGFSFFLIAAAAMLIALLFRLNIERRAKEIGLLLALGYPPTSVSRYLLTEGLIVSTAGTLAGLAGAVAYAQLMLSGLKSWWSGAANAPFLTLHTSAASFLIGFGASILVALISIALAVKGLSRTSPAALLAGAVASDPLQRLPAQRTSRAGSAAKRTATFTIACLLLATGLILATYLGSIHAAPGFFLVGTTLLVAALAALRFLLTPAPHAHDHTNRHDANRAPVARLSLRNAQRRPGRSMLTAALIASAAFLIISVQAFHLEADLDPDDKSTGLGGFKLFAESTAPIYFDVNTPAGRDGLSLSPETEALLADTQVIPFRLKPGESASCTNLFKPTAPRIIGATPGMIRRGGFHFASTAPLPAPAPQNPPDATPATGQANPWTLLDADLPDGAVPAIGDEAAVKWQLHSGLGQDFIITDDLGRPVTLRFVALLKSSVLQDEIIISEHSFTKCFPTREGYRFFLIDAPAAGADRLAVELERDLARFGFDVASTADRLADYLAVQNTYLLTFQSLGGFGLILGTLGLAAVMLRNIWERRGELALMRAVGFNNRTLSAIVFTESTLLVVLGLLAGLASAAVAVAPALLDRGQSIPFEQIGLIILAVLIVGALSGLLAVRAMLKTPLLPALRSE